MTTIDSDALRKARQACELLSDVAIALEEYGAGIRATRGWADPDMFDLQEQREQQEKAVEAVLGALGHLPAVLSRVAAIWERLGKPESPARPLLTWTPTPYAGYSGTAGGTEVFTIYWHTRKDDPKHALRPLLPGMFGETKSDDLEELKDAAERRLAEWIAMITSASDDSGS